MFPTLKLGHTIFPMVLPDLTFQKTYLDFFEQSPGKLHSWHWMKIPPAVFRKEVDPPVRLASSSIVVSAWLDIAMEWTTTFAPII